MPDDAVSGRPAGLELALRVPKTLSQVAHARDIGKAAAPCLVERCCVRLHIAPVTLSGKPSRCTASDGAELKGGHPYECSGTMCKSAPVN